MKKRNWHSVWTTTRLVLIAIGLLALYSFTLRRNEGRRLVATEVTFEGPKERFITADSVDKLLIENKTAPRDVRIVAVDLGKLEKSLNSNDLIAHAQVFLTIDGTLRATVKQKTPVARVLDETGSFYLDTEGRKMPLSSVSAARVPLVSGDLNAVADEKLGELFRAVHEDDFLRKNIVGAKILPDGNIVLESRGFDYRIEFGKAINMRRKFDNYKAFFQKAVRDSLIGQYRSINLRFIRQVVCQR